MASSSQFDLDVCYISVLATIKRVAIAIEGVPIFAPARELIRRRHRRSRSHEFVRARTPSLFLATTQPTSLTASSTRRVCIYARADNERHGQIPAGEFLAAFSPSRRCGVSSFPRPTLLWVKASSPVIITAPIFALSCAMAIEISFGLAMVGPARGGVRTSRRYWSNDSRSGSPVRFAIFASP